MWLYNLVVSWVNGQRYIYSDTEEEIPDYNEVRWECDYKE